MARVRSRVVETESVNQRMLRRGAVKRQHLSRWAVGRDELAPGVVGDTHLHPSTLERIRDVSAGAGVGQILVVSATNQSFASGGAYVTSDAIVYQHGFDAVTAPGDSIMWPVDAVGEIQVEFAWDTYQGGGTIEIEVDGVVPAWGLIASGSSGAKGCKRRSVHIAEGAAVKIKVTQSSGVAKTGDVHVEFSIPDPSVAVPPVPEVVLPSDVKVWWIGETLAATTSDGASVTTWPDSSGNSYDQTAINAPTFRAGSLNGLGTVEFDGVNDGMVTATGMTLMGATNEWTCFAVFEANGTAGDQAIVIGDDQTSIPGAARASWYLAVDTSVKAFANDGAVFVRDGAGTSLVADTWYVGESWRSTTHVEALLDGAGDGSSAVASVVESPNGIRVGSYPAGAGFFAGRIAEVIGWGRLLSATERTIVR